MTDELTLGVGTRCNRTGCMEHGRWKPVLQFRPYGYEGPPLEVAVDMRMCDAHKLAFSLDELLGVEGSEGLWDTVVKLSRVMNKAVPARARTQVRWVELN